MGGVFHTFHSERASRLPVSGKMGLSRTHRAGEDGMLLKTILNRIEKHSSFVYQEARFRDGDSDVIEIDVRSRRGARAI